MKFSVKKKKLWMINEVPLQGIYVPYQYIKGSEKSCNKGPCLILFGIAFFTLIDRLYNNYKNLEHSEEMLPQVQKLEAQEIVAQLLNYRQRLWKDFKGRV